jgi:hypothetical protein
MIALVRLVALRHSVIQLLRRPTQFCLRNQFIGTLVVLPEDSEKSSHRFGGLNAPDPLGSRNPVNPYRYASLSPLTFADQDGPHTFRLGFAPHAFGIENLNANRSIPIGSVQSTPQNRRLFDQVTRGLERIVANESRPEVRDAVARTLHVLRTQGVRIEMGPHVRGYGCNSNGTLAVNPSSASQWSGRPHDRISRRCAQSPHGRAVPRRHAQPAAPPTSIAVGPRFDPAPSRPGTAQRADHPTTSGPGLAQQRYSLSGLM